MTHHPKIGIIGVGWVGSQVKRYFEEIKGYKAGEDLLSHDIDPKKCAGDINEADIIFLTVPTPCNPKDGSCDISIIESAVAQIGGHKIVVIKSTVFPGTTELFQKKHPRHKFLFNPEFLTEARAWENFMEPDRQIVGFTSRSADVAPLILSLLPGAPFMSPSSSRQITATEAELIKYAGNVYLSRKVNWANALAKVAEKLGADYENIRQGMSADPRIGKSHLDINHGGYRGFGGFCLTKDTSALIAFVKQIGLDEVYDLMMADWKFNENLLAEQGLTVSDVSRHITETEIIEKKRRNSKK